MHSYIQSIFKNNKAPGADSVLNKFLKDFRKAIIKPPYKKVDKSECGNYRGIGRSYPCIVYQTNTLKWLGLCTRIALLKVGYLLPKVIEVGNQISSWFRMKPGVKQGSVLSPIIWIILTDFVLRNAGKTMGEHGIKWGRKTILDLDCPNDLSILDFGKMNELLEVLRVQGARIGLEFNLKKTKSLRLEVKMKR